MTNVFLIHGYNGIPQIFEWLKEELTKLNYNIIMPKFPPRELINYEDWKEILDKYKTSIKKDSLIICHSIGNEFIIKYLTENKLPIDLYISLAGFAEYFETPNEILNVALKKMIVKEDEIHNFIKLCNNKYSIYSNNDHIVPLEVLKRYSELINSKPMMIENIGHMGKKSGLKEIPQVIEIIKKIRQS